MIICPTNNSILAYSKSGNLLWEYEELINESYIPISSFFFGNDVYMNSYFIGKYPIDVNTGQQVWPLGDNGTATDFTGLPAYDEAENALYYTGPDNIYIIANP